MITIPTKYLKAALLAAGKKDIRLYLNGVLIECCADGTRVVATDGTIAAVMRHEVDSPIIMPMASFIVPRDVVEASIKAKRLETTFDCQSGQHIMNGSLLFTPVDGTFPDYRRIFHKQVSGEASVFNPELFATFGKMAQALGCTPSAVTLHQNGQSAAMVSIVGVPEFAGVMSPLNLKAKDAPVRPGVAQWI